LQLALRYLSYRSRSEVEVRRHLRNRGCAPALIDPTIAKLRSLHYLDDESFARSWALGRAQGRSYGPRRIEQELRSKGVGQPVIRQALGQAFDEVDEASLAQRLLERHFRGKDLKEEKTLRRAVAFLLRRGYRSKVIFNLLRYSTDEQ
jgi:regulatory protein